MIIKTNPGKMNPSITLRLYKLFVWIKRYPSKVVRRKKGESGGVKDREMIKYKVLQ